MGKECKRKFGVSRIHRFNLDLICKDCGQRAGLHYDTDCPTVDIKTGKPFKEKYVKVKT